MKTYSAVPINNSAEIVPEYMKRIPLEGIYAYFFNWHPNMEIAPITEISAWYAQKRGWTWRED